MSKENTHRPVSDEKVKEMERHLVMLMDCVMNTGAVPLSEDRREMIAEQITLLIRAVVADELSKRGE